MTTYLSPLRKTYDLEFSPLYELSNKKKLAEILGVDLPRLPVIANSDATGLYRIFKDKKTNRFITEPIGELAIIHKKLLKLLTRIKSPEYVHSAIKKRSYKTNAQVHVDGENILKIDIKKFFPSIKFHYIFNFFREVLCCSIDIATILAKLTTVKTNKFGVHLPTGSCISPILSFFANKYLFDSIHGLCAKNGCVLTVYVDDITISGANANKSLLTKIAEHIHNAGYRYHKIQTYHKAPATVTGLIVFNGKISLPDIRMKRIREIMAAVKASNSKATKEKLISSLIGRISEAEHIEPRFKSLRKRILEKYSIEWKSITDKRSQQAKLRAKNLKAKVFK